MGPQPRGGGRKNVSMGKNRIASRRTRAPISQKKPTKPTTKHINMNNTKMIALLLVVAVVAASIPAPVEAGAASSQWLTLAKDMWLKNQMLQALGMPTSEASATSACQTGRATSAGGSSTWSELSAGRAAISNGARCMRTHADSETGGVDPRKQSFPLSDSNH